MAKVKLFGGNITRKAADFPPQKVVICQAKGSPVPFVLWIKHMTTARYKEIYARMGEAAGHTGAARQQILDEIDQEFLAAAVLRAEGLTLLNYYEVMNDGNLLDGPEIEQMIADPSMEFEVDDDILFRLYRHAWAKNVYQRIQDKVQSAWPVELKKQQEDDKSRS